MKKVMLTGMLALTAFATSASAVNVLQNGDWGTSDETGWTRWSAPWSTAGNYAVGSVGNTPPAGQLWLNSTDYNSYGWLQVVPVPAGESVTVSADWAGDVNPYGWAEVMLFSSANPNGSGDTVIKDGNPVVAASWANRADIGAPLDTAFKKDGWGQNPPAVWDWQAASLSPASGGNGGTITSLGYVAVALKLGTGDWNPNHGGLSASFDNLTLTPEPAAALLLLAGLPLLRRLRA